MTSGGATIAATPATWRSASTGEAEGDTLFNTDLSRLIAVPVMRCSGSLRLLSGNWPISLAVIASTTTSFLFLFSAGLTFAVTGGVSVIVCDAEDMFDVVELTRLST